MFLQRPYAHFWSWGEGKIATFCNKLWEDISPRSTTEIYDTFLNWSSNKDAFVGAANKELIFLKDLRWSQETIPWQEFLNLLERQSIYLAAPKIHYARAILITDDVLIFATSIAPIMFAGKIANVEGENVMMEARWRKFQLSVQIPLCEQKTIKSCARWFCELLFVGADA